jgi:hypothetical protein
VPSIAILDPLYIPAPVTLVFELLGLTGVAAVLHPSATTAP